MDIEISSNFNTLSGEKLINEVAELALSMKDYEKIATGKYKVVINGKAFLELFESFNNMFNGKSIQEGRSLLKKEALKSQVASSILNVKDFALHKNSLNRVKFDEEGIATRELNIIENGVLANLIHTSESAKEFGAEPTGHTILGSTLTAHEHFIVISSSNSNSAEFDLQKSNNIVYIESLDALHSGVQPYTGSFSLPFSGWLIKNGKKISIEAGTVAGNYLELLKNIEFISANGKVVNDGVCGDVWIKELSITGE